MRQPTKKQAEKYKGRKPKPKVRSKHKTARPYKRNGRVDRERT